MKTMCPAVITGYFVFMAIYVLRPSCFCEILALNVSWITYDHLYIYIHI